ncbi:peptidyl-prolyl cis-trans isomerase FKBP15-1-like isoform X2 [Phalaenopsis equestris]|uniref:peptidyl-prolyl cis-trans isomerase FKBP15-1-like isoform X2 n=1 Tax=Phalaenopsis equestris TaxID=78828 RepID=UPI0009E5387E|nr:peptidyl-prolyl cis-trans isomerase FKBP15-1-like isoform X2 [Phalaenopsis equestris]
MMDRVLIFITFIAGVLLIVSAKKSSDVADLQIGVKGMLTNGNIFDSSYERGEPIEFELGKGQVIKGWDQGLLGMCVGEKRKLKIPAKLGYGAQGSLPKIPGGATLIFDTELMAVNGKTSSSKQSTEGNEEL